MLICTNLRSVQKFPPYQIRPGVSTQVQAASALLDALKSFPSDLGMVRYIASHGKDLSPLLCTANTPLFESMPFFHMKDPHTNSAMCYFYPSSLVRQVCKASPPGKPFVALTDKIFAEVTGKNPRREALTQASFENQPFVQQTRAAQKLTLYAKLVIPPPSARRIADPDAGPCEIDYTLDASWLAGMVGAIELKPRAKNARSNIAARPALLVTLCCDNPSQLVVIRKPARGLKPEDARIPDEVEQEAVSEVRAMLGQGVPLSAVPHPPVEAWKHAHAKWDAQRNDYWIVFASPQHQPQLWEAARHIKLRLPVYTPVEYSVGTALVAHGNGVERGAFESLKQLVQDSVRSTPEVLNRVLYYLDTFDQTIALNCIGRDGSGMEHQVNTNDVAAYDWLLRFSMLFPGALRPAPHRLNVFTVPTSVLLWHVVLQLRELVTSAKLAARLNVFAGPAGSSAAAASAAAAPPAPVYWNFDALRSPFQRDWLHQTEAYQDMVRKHERGRGAHYLHSPPGAGKSHIVCKYLKYLATKQLLPGHVIWSLPGEAIKSVSAELLAFGFRVHWMLPQKNSSKKEVPLGVTKLTNVAAITPNVITLIEHDDLRKMPDTLRNLSDDMFLVMDEAHKALADSQRTSIALEVARLAAGGFIALSGTPTIDNKIYKLVPWLSLIVPFTVNLLNFWCACNSMVAQQIDTGVHVSVEEVDAEWKDAHSEAQYRRLVPEKLGGTNSHPTNAQIAEATKLCYDSCTEKMVQLALNVLFKNLHFADAAHPELWQGGLFIVAKDNAHQDQLKRALIVQSSQAGPSVRVLTDSDIFLIRGNASLHLDDKSVLAKKVPDYPVVITTLRKSSGYTLSRLKASVTSVYPSNLASRIQITARINRLSQQAKHLTYFVVSIGLLTIIRKYHNEAASIDRALKDMAINVTIEEHELQNMSL
jgi:hypothetical protein